MGHVSPQASFWSVTQTLGSKILMITLAPSIMGSIATPHSRLRDDARPRAPTRGGGGGGAGAWRRVARRPGPAWAWRRWPMHRRAGGVGRVLRGQERKIWGSNQTETGKRPPCILRRPVHRNTTGRADGTFATSNRGGALMSLCCLYATIAVPPQMSRCLPHHTQSEAERRAALSAREGAGWSMAAVVPSGGGSPRAFEGSTW